MLASILTLLPLAAFTHAASISCGAATSSGALYYSAPDAQTYIGQLGVTEARGNAEFLAKYPSTNVIAHNISIIPCNSTYLNATPSDTAIPVILQLVDDPSECLGLISAGINADVTITKQQCQYGDDSSILQYIFTQDKEAGYVVPQ
jgi:hypothetical protein